MGRTQRRGEVRLVQARDGARPLLGPQSVSVVLTNACNLNCITCWSYSPLRLERPAVEWTRRRLDRHLLQSLFVDLAELRVERVIFTGGGDPLAHPDFLEIARDAKDAGLRVTLISNLTLLRQPGAFLDLQLDTIQANFSCADAETYVAFHPNRSAADYARLLESLRAISSTSTDLKLVFVACRSNVHVLNELLKIAAELRASVQLKLMSASPDTRSLLLSDAQRNQLLRTRADLTQHATDLGVRVNLDAFFAALAGDTVESFPINEIGCFAGHFYARVDAQGNVRYCCNPASELQIGSLHEQSFSELWWSDHWQSLRQQLYGGRYVRGCDRCGKFDLNLRIATQLRSLPSDTLPVL